MKRVITASVYSEGQWYVAQALDVDVASQGMSENEALANLTEALQLYFERLASLQDETLESIQLRGGGLRSADNLPRSDLYKRDALR